MILKKSVMIDDRDLMLVQMCVHSRFVVMEQLKLPMVSEDQKYVMMEIQMRMMHV